jgi:large subunit ribosomal protein L29
MATAKELREKTDAELAANELELRRKLFDARYKHATRQLEDTASIGNMRRDLARVLSIKTARSRSAGVQDTKKVAEKT